jgi:ubiquinone/menaquinone biosynthesis C-methylase UbiE
MSATRDDVSQLGDPAQQVRHLDTCAQVNAERTQRVDALPQVGEGHRVLDVGRGPGTDTLPLARLVGPTGHVSGVDLNRAMVEHANQRAAAGGMGAWVDHRVCNAPALPFADASFDACHAERVFLHLPRPEAALAEMVRVVTPGGRIAVIDGDGATCSIDTPESDIERQILPFWIGTHHNGSVSRRLDRFCQRHGLVDVAMEIPAGRGSMSTCACVTSPCTPGR